MRRLPLATIANAVARSRVCAGEEGASGAAPKSTPALRASRPTSSARRSVLQPPSPPGRNSATEAQLARTIASTAIERSARTPPPPRLLGRDPLHAAERELGDVPCQLGAEAAGIALPALAMQEGGHRHAIEHGLRDDAEPAALHFARSETRRQAHHDALGLAHHRPDELGDDHRQRIARID